ncbi:glycoside hydrolase family 3 protein [Leptospira ognonensis]|uniref:beta-N-acetylhexosaminidase n=1 Tax=Leptospira ognonensis TaxID=2484945 RepID=A0A4R9K4X4_9LEPT|nr:glycoside hydrolase family 3 protein [Leptospira ognonensis]TGL61223.1 glycoside hydrolase family 3 protein [Leptospira ognonensis]
MNRIFYRIIFSLFLIFGFIGSSYFFNFYLTELAASERDSFLNAKAWELTNNLSPEELVGQTIHIAIPNKTVDAVALEEIKNTKPGGIILFGKNLGKKEEILSLTDNLQKAATDEKLPPFLISTDQEGGRVFRVKDGVTAYPGAMAVGQTGNEAWGRTVGFVTSFELRKLGINFLFAPVLDINNNPFNPVINTRSFGSDISRVNTVGVAYEQGARLGGALPVIKHFPGHGDTTVDSHLGLPIIKRTLSELESLELVPFKKAIESGAEAVMTAHIVYPLIDDKYPATLSKKILTGILREKLRFDGIIITDAMEMHAISKNYEKERPGVLTILAGANIVLLTSWGETARKFKEQLLTAYNAGEFLYKDQNGVEKNILKEAVYRQIRKKLELGLYNADSSHPGVMSENQNLKDFLEAKELARQNQFKEYEKQGFYLKEITKDSIRAFPDTFQTRNPAKSSSIQFVKNQLLKKSLTGVKVGNIKNLTKIAASKEITNLLFDSSSENEIGLVAALAKKHPTKNFVVFHGGTPFVKLPQMKNLQYILSFSLTSHSWEAMGERYLSEEAIPKVDLILLPKEGKSPTLGAFPQGI